jgi:hypothetical protein
MPIKIVFMPKNKILALTVAILAVFAISALADDGQSKSTNAPVANPTDKKSQSDVASKTAKFDIIPPTNETYKTALDAHALDLALKQVDKDGAFKGTVSAIYEPRSGGLAIVNFDKNYRTALTALLKGADFDTFPDLKTLVGKDVLVTGTFISYQGRAEIVLTNTAQIKLVEAAK